MVNVFTAISLLKLLDNIALKSDVFEGAPAKFIEVFQQRCARESIREICHYHSRLRNTRVSIFLVSWQLS